jgi:long-subunit acyl-CoA synthetase (AMP-forming)
MILKTLQSCLTRMDGYTLESALARAQAETHWYRQLTDSIGEIDSCGRIKIVDRVKNVVKLSQG